MTEQQRIKRREFLEGAVSGAAGMLLAGTVLPAQAAQAAAAPAAAQVDPTALVPLGKLKMCRIGAGTGTHGDNRQSNQTRMGKERFETLLRYEYEQNVRMFDCADLYGVHSHVARALTGKPRDSYQLSSKIWFLRGGVPEAERPDADVCVRRFLEELEVEYLDLVQMHCMMSSDWPQQMRKQMDILEKLKEQGLIRAHGVSVHSLAALQAAALEPWVDVIHVRINPAQVYMDGTMDDVVPIIRGAHQAGKGIIGMKLAGQGVFNEEQREKSIQWVMGLGCVDVLIVGFEKPELSTSSRGSCARSFWPWLPRPSRQRGREAEGIGD
jgi:aryl-alcohol dehydrogenase-like predicted oxidoreductase